MDFQKGLLAFWAIWIFQNGFAGKIILNGQNAALVNFLVLNEQFLSSIPDGAEPYEQSRFPLAPSDPANSSILHS